jgi:septal ring factor EnvC (AmiA/AmiB activator)
MPLRAWLRIMKGKTGIVVLVVLCIALGVGLLLRHARAVDEQHKAEAKIKQLSDDVVHTQDQLSEQKKVNDTLEKTLEVKSTEAQGLSNRLDNVTATLLKTEQQAKVAAEQAKDEIAKRDAKIADLEGQNDDLTKKMTDLNTSISTLESQISDTKNKLAASEGDRDFLLKELKRLQAEKAELERKFNDLAVMRDQVRKLRDELSIARRLEWIRRGLYGSEKGAEKLQKGLASGGPQTNYDLNVEVKQSGGAKILPPSTNAPATNAPPANPPPANPPPANSPPAIAPASPK